MTTNAPARRPRKDAAANRAGILAAAARTLAHDPHASIDTIARAAGLTRRALYGHFDDREALLRELLAGGAQRFNALAERVPDAAPVIELAQLTARLWHEAAHVQVAAAIALDDAHVAQTADALAPLRRRVLGILQRGQADGSLRTDIPAATLARLVEEAARSVVTRLDPASPTAAALAVRVVLGIVGLSWREADALIDDLAIEED